MSLDLSVDGRSKYLYIGLVGYLRILGAPSVQSCCTLSISASYSVFVLTSPAFMRSSANHLAGPHGRLALRNSKSVPIAGTGG